MEMEEIKREEVKVSDAVTIVVRRMIFQGVEGIDIRKYVTTKRYTGRTKKGIFIPIEAIENVIKAIKEVRK